jgi:L-lactate dehydrogenase complex protein LldF
MDPRSAHYPRLARETLEQTPGVRDAVTQAALAFDAHRLRAYGEVDVDAWRRWAEQVKSHVLTHLDTYLEQAEARLVEHGAHVHWADDAAAARRVLDELVSRYGVSWVVKGKSMVSEELGLNDHLASQDVEAVESDLGEYIIQLLDEPPSHILGPAIHRTLDDIRRIFHEVHGTAPEATPEELCAAARSTLREVFLSADMGITGGNFVVAETGTLALIENEGNIRISTSAPRVHVAFVGIEKLLPRWSDLAVFLQLTARAATGQPVGTFVSLLHGPARDDEPDGPDEVHVVFVDNGRSRVLADPDAWEALRCLRCGACLNVCPVYRQTGGHAYGYVYSGPIGAVLAPGLLGLSETLPLPFASSLCGACAEACPVRIPIPELLLAWRRRAVDEGLTPRAERAAFRAFSAVATRPGLYRAAGRLVAATGGRMARYLPVLGSWESVRAPLDPSGGTVRRGPRHGGVAQPSDSDQTGAPGSEVEPAP